jgi:hypothetical protein
MDTNYEKRMEEAIKDFKAYSESSIRAVAAANDVDHTTLSRRLNGQTSRAIAREPQQLLTNEQEALLKRWILDLEIQGHAPTFKAVRELAAIISRSAGGPETVGKNWINRFIHRHPDLTSKVGRKIDTQRADSTTVEALEAWFTQLQTVQTHYKISPQNCYNMDESGIALGVCSNQWVLGTAHTTSTFKKTPENREWVSIIEAISTAGKRLQPLVIFKGQSLQSRWFYDKHTPNYQYTISPNGWTSNEIGLRWLDQIFLPQTAIEGGYRLLLVDGHKSHATHEFMWKCFQNNVVVFYLFPHSSHVLQPLDLACFSLVKSRYRQQLTDLARFDDTSAVKKAKFLQIYQKASQEGLSPYQIRAGWSAAGIHPWDPRKVVRSRLVLQTTKTTQKQPSTPPSRKRRYSQSDLWSTPTNRREFSDTIQSAIQQDPISRPLRLFLGKTSKTFDRMAWQLAQKDLQLAKQREQLEQLQRQRRKTKEIDCNLVFANIETIQKAKEAMTLLATTRTTRRTITTVQTVSRETPLTPQEALMSVFDSNGAVEE